jgi:hypothetical protein
MTDVDIEDQTVETGEVLPAIPAEARDSTPEERQERAEAMFAIEQRIKESLAVGRSAAWELAKSLYEFNEENGWTALGYENQTDWLAQPDIGMTKTEFFRMVRRYRELVINRQIEQEVLLQLPPSKVDILMPTIEAGKVGIDEIVDDINSMGARDLREKYMGVLKSSDPTEPGEEDSQLDPSEKARLDTERKLWDEIRMSAGNVESWFDVGGDRRKAQRHFRKLKEVHPVFAALQVVDEVLEGTDDAPEKATGQTAWAEVMHSLNLPLPDGMDR